MTTPQQFLQSFLQEKAAAYAETNARLAPVYTKFFGEPLSQHVPRFLMRDPAQAVFEDVKRSAGSVIAITREPAPRDTLLRTRYHLAAIDESWKIVRIDRECFLCRGTGLSGGSQCLKCNGEGWYDPQKR